MVEAGGVADNKATTVYILALDSGANSAALLD